ncbi:MAG: SDR family NAD(P)-dependent oxidoreductase, partial [Pseudomonadota bacterium]
MRHVLITGASDGIGRALTDIYGETDWQVWATGRRAREEVVPPLPGTVQYVAADLTGEHALADALPPKLDLAILNAGAGKVAPLA